MNDYKIYWTRECDIEGDQLVCKETGEIYNMNDFMVTPHSDFDAVSGISNTSALAITLSPDCESATLNCIG